jgi:hypothetical protein
MMSQYIASVPQGGQVRSEIQTFFEEFYKVTDNPVAHDRYVDMFTNDAKIFMGVNEFTGREGISLNPAVTPKDLSETDVLNQK